LTSSRFASLPRSGNSIERQRVPSGHNIGGHDLETDTLLADDTRNGHLETLHCSEYPGGPLSEVERDVIAGTGTAPAA